MHEKLTFIGKRIEDCIDLFQNHVIVLVNRGPNVAKAQMEGQNFQDG